MTEHQTTIQESVRPEQRDEDVPVPNAPDWFVAGMFSELHGYPSLEEEAEVRVATALVGKSDEVVRVYSKPGKTGTIVVVFVGGDEVEVEVRV
jgi:hypothetical protein